MIRPTSGQCSFGPDACRGKAASPASLSLGRLAELRRAPDAGGYGVETRRG